MTKAGPKYPIRLLLRRFFLLLGSILILVYAAARIYGTLVNEFEMQAYRETPISGEAKHSTAVLDFGVLPSNGDRSLWSKARNRAYERVLLKPVADPIGILRIPKVGIEVPVLDGIDEITLNAGAGRIPGTALPDEVGNIGIAGHRDGFFRVLKDITTGDEIELQTHSGNRAYIVSVTKIVQPNDVSVLQPSSTPSITLVTCYPFYYIGAAPRRYIVHAVLR